MVPSCGRALFLAGIFLMVTGDLPRLALLPSRDIRFLPCPPWDWLYVALLAGAFVLLAASRTLRWERSSTAAALGPGLGLLAAAFLLSLVFSQVPALSWWAFGCFLAIAGFTLAVVPIVEDDAIMAALPVVLAAAAAFLALRVIAWRVDEGLVDRVAYRNTAWLGTHQIAWVLNLLAPLLLVRLFTARAPAAWLYGGAWLLSGSAIGLMFAATGIVVFALTTAILCAVGARSWRRWMLPVAALVLLGLGVMAVNPRPVTRLVDSAVRLDRNVSAGIRLHIWRVTARMVADHPLTGTGLGTYDDVAYSQYGTLIYPHFFRNGYHAHNTHLHVLAETGAVGFLAWCWFWLTIVRAPLRRWREADGPDRLKRAAVLCFLVAFLVHSMTEALVAARVHASLRMNLTLALLVVYGLRLAAPERSASTC